MKRIKLFEEYINNSGIEDICNMYGIGNYTINDDGSIDANDSVDICNKNITEIPLTFNKVSGSFLCVCNNLTSLKGCPKEVGGNFYCSDNKLITLEGSPKEVDGNFSCSYNKLITLEGCPSSIGGYFDCIGNPVYQVWKLIDDKEYLELFLDYDIINGYEVDLIKLNDLLDMMGKPKVNSIKGYKCI